MPTDLLDTPWKISNNLVRLLQWPLIRIFFLCHGIKVRQGWRIFGFPLIQKHRKSKMDLGPGLQLRSSLSSNPVGANHPVILSTLQAGAVLKIGENFGMTGGNIIAGNQITIGDNVAIGGNSLISDTDFHPVNHYERGLNPQGGQTAPVVIEDNVFIGTNCLILKGVTIGKGSVIGAGSVVTRNIPAGVIAAGNPAKVIKSIHQDES